MKSTFWMFVLHKRHGQFWGTQFLILVWIPSDLLSSYIRQVKLSITLVLKQNSSSSIMHCARITWFKSSIFADVIVIGIVYLWKTSWIIDCDSPIFILNISVSNNSLKVPFFVIVYHSELSLIYPSYLVNQC